MVMAKWNLRAALPYVGLPVILTAILVLGAGGTGADILLQRILIAIFGYIASVFDLKERRIPNSLILGMLAAWVLIMVPKLFINTDAAIRSLSDSLLGFAFGGGVFLIVYLVSRKGLGGGDVKFMAAAGLYLGVGWTIPAMLFGTILAALAALTLLALKKIKRKDKIPLAQFLYAGILITLFLQ
ncbi:MAG: A24 family peptidase [Oscillospiraceae bacterium]|nr:A24 family peptidase [Oscillospiraceae bacterium]